MIEKRFFVASLGFLTMEQNPFSEQKIDDLLPLEQAEDKVVCSLCNRRRKYFCYACRTYVNGLEKMMPTVKVRKYVYKILSILFIINCDLGIYAKLSDSLSSLLHMSLKRLYLIVKHCQQPAEQFPSSNKLVSLKNYEVI